MKYYTPILTLFSLSNAIKVSSEASNPWKKTCYNLRYDDWVLHDQEYWDVELEGKCTYKVNHVEDVYFVERGVC